MKKLLSTVLPGVAGYTHKVKTKLCHPDGLSGLNAASTLMQVPFQLALAG